jgi:hypothetical protein
MINKARGLDKVFKKMHFSDSLAPTVTNEYITDCFVELTLAEALKNGIAARQAGQISKQTDSIR